MAKTKTEPNQKDEGDQIPNPRKKSYKELIQRIPGATKFEKFQYMRGMAFSEEKIMQTLSIKSKDAFRKMDERADEIVANYLRYQAKTGHMQNLSNALIIAWENVFALKSAAEDAKKLRESNPKETKYYYPENHFRTSLSNALKEAVELQHKTPLAAAFDKFIKENLIEGNNSKGGPGKLPLLPEHLKN